MSVRLRIQICIGLLMGALLAAALTTVSPVLPTADATTAASRTAAVASGVSARMAAAGETAGRKAGAKAGAKAGRKAGAKAGLKAAALGAKAGRKAGAKAGAKAGRRVGGSTAGRKAGAKAGAKAGRKVGARIAAEAGPDCGNWTYRKDDGTAWKCTFGDDFTGTRLDTSKWRVMTSEEFNFGKRLDCYMGGPGNVSVGDGMLTLTSRREASMFNCDRGSTNIRTQYSAGMVSTYEKYTQAYGRFEFRAKLPYTEERGVQTSMWLWPDGANGSSWPASGEIDVAEWYSQFPDRVIPYLHYSTSLLGGSGATNNNCLVADVGGWHTYLLEWAPNSIKISYDGDLCLENHTGAPFNKPYMMAMFQGMGLRRNAPTATTPAVSRAQFAWVRAWS